jgi:hypothetical protein
LGHIGKEEVERKIKETEIYFLDVAKKRNPTAYILIMTEINYLKNKFKIEKE